MKIVAFTGAGISLESGIPTFRNSDESLYSDEELMNLLSVNGLKNNPEEVFTLHNKYRKNIRFKQPNLAHKILKIFEDTHIVNIITQNIDDLHEKAESLNVYHLHGEIFKSRLMEDDSLNPITFDCRNDLFYGETLEDDSELRPHTVLFGELPYNIEKSEDLISECDVLLIIGTSLEITYTLPLLCNANRLGVRVVYIDPSEQIVPELESIFTLAVFEHIKTSASEGLKNITL